MHTLKLSFKNMRNFEVILKVPVVKELGGFSCQFFVSGGVLDDCHVTLSTCPISYSMYSPWLSRYGQSQVQPVTSQYSKVGNHDQRHRFNVG